MLSFAAALIVLLVGKVSCQMFQELVYSVTYTPPTPIASASVQFDLTFYPNGDTVEVAHIVDPTTGLLSDPACEFTTAAGTLTAGTDGSGSATRTLTVFIDGNNGQFKNSAGTVIACTYQATSPGMYTFNIRGLATTSSTTGREYTVTASGSDVSNVVLQGSTTFSPTPPGVTNLTPNTIVKTLTVVDDATKTDQATLALGTPFRLKFTLTINDYEPNLVIAGATVTECTAEPLSGTPKVTMITSSCVATNNMYKNMNPNDGFARDATESTVAGTTKTYVAYSPLFEMAGFAKSPVTGNNVVKFECTLEYCLSDSSLTPNGQCGANHCPNARRKREVKTPDAVVSATVNVTSDQSARTCTNCSESTVFQATTAGLGTLLAILVGIIILAYTHTRYTIRKMLGKANDSVSSGSSVAGCDVISNVTLASSMKTS